MTIVTVAVVTIVMVTYFSKNNLTPRQPMRCSWCSFLQFLWGFLYIEIHFLYKLLLYNIEIKRISTYLLNVVCYLLTKKNSYFPLGSEQILCLGFAWNCFGRWHDFFKNTIKAIQLKMVILVQSYLDPFKVSRCLIQKVGGQ